MMATKDKILVAIGAVIVVIVLGYILITQGAGFLRSLLPGVTTTTDKPDPGSTKTTTDGNTTTTTTVPDDNTITRTTTGPGGLNSITVVGPDVRYVNPVICALTGQFCDPNTTPVKPGDTTQLVISAPPNYATLPKAQDLVDKLNAGIPWTLDEIAWARANEPTLYNMAPGGVF
jgi:hypothetical protein